MSSYDILVVMLSTALLLALVLAVVLLIYLIQVIRNLKRISDKAVSVVDSVEAASQFVKKTAEKASVTHAVANIVDAVTEHTRKHKGKK